jgi:syntaxin 1B/2/3
VQQEQSSRPRHDVLSDCRAIGLAIDDLDSRMDTLREHQRQFLFGDRNVDVNGLSKQILNDYRGLAERIKRINDLPESQELKNRSQVGMLNRRIRKAIYSYQQSESEFRKDVREEQRRQYLIVRPDTKQEIQEIQEATRGDMDVKIFQQALLTSDRRDQAQNTLSNVRQRHDDLQQIEMTMLELQQLFDDLDEMMVQQEPMVQTVEQKAVDTHENLEMGNVQLDRAITSARVARRKKWICLGVCVAIILVGLIVIMVWTSMTGQFVSLLPEHGYEIQRVIVVLTSVTCSSTENHTHLQPMFALYGKLQAFTYIPNELLVSPYGSRLGVHARHSVFAQGDLIDTCFPTHAFHISYYTQASNVNVTGEIMGLECI